MHWLSLLKEIACDGFLIFKAYCVNVSIDIKPIYLNKPNFRLRSTIYLDKIYFCFAKIKLYGLNYLPD